jgi:hypothetical protein
LHHAEWLKLKAKSDADRILARVKAPPTLPRMLLARKSDPPSGNAVVKLVLCDAGDLDHFLPRELRLMKNSAQSWRVVVRKLT